MPRVSVIIPVWNGESVIRQCLEAVYASGSELHEVICVDNASQDRAAAVIAENYPQVRLLRQPVNLGFAGGVNAGIEAATGDVLVLLNQDCLLQPGCLATLATVLTENPPFGIAGCTLLEQDGTVNHTGAELQRPLAYGRHLTDHGNNQPRLVEYVTGTVFAIKRKAWEEIGRFDDDFYPAYYEEVDYCYRARRKGWETVYVPQARAVHLHSSREWQAEPIKHTVNQHRARYRFVCKQFDAETVEKFFAAEETAVQAEIYFDQAVSRVLAARDTLRDLPRILSARQRDLGETVTVSHQRQLSVGFTGLVRQSFTVAERLCLPQFTPLSPQQPAQEYIEQIYRQLVQEREATLQHLYQNQLETYNQRLQAWQTAVQQLENLQRQEYDLLSRIYFTPPNISPSEPAWKRLVRLFILRPLSFLVGRDYLLQSQLNTLHVARMDYLSQVLYLFRDQQEQIRHEQQTYADHQAKLNLAVEQTVSLQQQLLYLLKILVDYDYR